MRSSTRIVLGLVILAGMATLAWRYVGPTLPRAGVAEGEFDCPHDPGTIALAGSQASMPGYNDCQQFIDAAGQAYLERVGIYLRDNAPGTPAPATLSCVAGSPDARSTLCANLRGEVPTAVAVAVVRSWNAAVYVPLGIEPGWNCLYLESVPGETGALAARMVPVASESDCRPDVRTTVGLGGTPLAVTRNAVDNVPPAARWGWDQVNNWQYVVIVCPEGWCAIGSPGFQPSEYWDEEVPADNVRGEPRFARRPGNDIQRLALVGETGLVPGAGWGVAVPEPGASHRNAEDFAGRWVPTVSLAYTDQQGKYERALNLRKGKPARVMTRVELCGEQVTAGDPPSGRCSMPFWVRHWFVKDCSVDGASNMRWISRITSHAGGAPRYRCVTRTAHDDLVPGTVRWRWVATDETIWTPCGPACCWVDTGLF